LCSMLIVIGSAHLAMCGIVRVLIVVCHLLS
jgi:hypothetical protein